jgi:Ca2+-binding EF-hand superfamily protein
MDPAAAFSRLDKNGDGKITSDESPFPIGNMDADGDGAVTKEELESAMKKRASAGGN